MDSLIVCNKCGSDACYTDQVSSDVSTYMCYGCGFVTNSLMKEGSEFLIEQAEMLPELYKDLFFTDNEGKIWMPSVVNQPKKGMVFAQGNNKDNWMWTGVKAVKVSEEDKVKYPIPGKKNEYYEYRMDMTTAMHFPEKDYMEALSYIGILPE